MSVGHGRGFYGKAQLDRPRRPGNGWFKVAVIVGLGAVIWFMLPSIGPSPKPDEEPSPPHPNEEQTAQARGFSATKLYEDSVLANARELKAAGAKVVFAPHLQHLEARLES